MGIIYHNDGKMVPGLVNRNGWRIDKEDTMKWGGVQIEKDMHGDTPWLHSLAVKALREKSRRRW